MSGCILVAEDEDSTRRALRSVLEDAGYRVEEARDGIEAREKLFSRRPEHSRIDLLLADIFMPRMGGLELVDEIRRRGISLPVLPITAYGDEKLADQLKKRGCLELLPKPFGPDDLLQRVSSASKTTPIFSWAGEKENNGKKAQALCLAGSIKASPARFLSYLEGLYFKNLLQWVKGLWIRSRLRRSVTRVSLRLMVVRRHLEAVCFLGEYRFMELGSLFQSIYSGAEQMTSVTDDTFKIIGVGSEAGFLSGLEGISRSSVAELQACKSGISGKLRKIDSIAGQLKKLYERCLDIEKSALYLKVVALNIKKECSFSKETGVIFNDFVKEIRELSRSLAEICEDLRNESEKARENHLRAKSEIFSDLEHLAGLADAGEETLETAIERIRGIMDVSSKALESLRFHSREISRQAGEIVVAVQYQDITRQRLEHITSAIIDARRLCWGKEGNFVFDKENIENLARVNAVLGLQARQLKGIISDIENVRAKISKAFQEIGNSMEGIAQDISMIGGESQGDGQGAFSDLESGLEQMKTLSDQGNEVAEKMSHTSLSASRAASSLSRHVEQVRGMGTVDMHIKALNAIVKSARLEERGKNLEVLAQEVREVSVQSSGFAVDILEILSAVKNQVEELADLPDGGEKPGYSGYGNTGLEKAIQDLSRIYGIMRKNSEQSLSRAQGLKHDICHAESRLGFLENISGQLYDCLYLLEDMSQSLDYWLCQWNDQEIGEIEGLRGTYTMEQERDLHDRFVESKRKTGEYVFQRGNETRAMIPGDLGAGFAGEENGGKDQGGNVDLF